MCSEPIPHFTRATFVQPSTHLGLLTKQARRKQASMLRRKPTRVEDRADVAEEYELYLIEKEQKKQEQQQHYGGGVVEDFQMRDDDAATATPLRQQQQRAQRNTTRSRIGIGH